MIDTQLTLDLISTIIHCTNKLESEVGFAQIAFDNSDKKIPEVYESIEKFCKAIKNRYYDILDMGREDDDIEFDDGRSLI